MEAQAILCKYDADCNGTLDRIEFARLVDELRDFLSTRAKAKEQPQDEISYIFNTFDIDSSNAIERELLAALRALGLPVKDESEAARILQRYDDDCNGRLDALEFRKLVLDLRGFLDRCRDAQAERVRAMSTPVTR